MAGKKNLLKNALLGGASVVALSFGMANFAVAADAVGEITTGDTIAATDADGLLESNETGAVAITVAAPNADLTLGADAADSITITESSAATALTVTVLDPDTNNDVIFAGDLRLKGNAGDTLIINVTGASETTTFQGNATVTTGTSIAVRAGDSAGGTTSLVFDTAFAENLVFDATVDSISAGDTINLTVQNSNGTDGRTFTFSKAVGGTTAVDAITIDAATGDDQVIANFSSSVGTTTLAVNADTTANKSAAATIAGNLTATGAVTVTAANNAAATLELQGSVNSAASIALDDDTGQASLTLNSTTGVMQVTGTINGAGTTEGDLIIKDGTAGAAGDLVTIVSAVGATQSLDTIQIGSATEAGNVVFQSSVRATTITLDGGDAAAETALAEFQDAITANIVLDNAAGAATLTVNALNGAKSVTGTINAQDAGDGTFAVIDGNDNAAPDAITVTGVVGGSARLGAITVGGGGQGGSVIFLQDITAVGTVTVTGGDKAAEDSVAEFEDVVTAATSFLLDDTTGGGSATLKFDASEGAQTNAGTIDGAADNEGTVIIVDEDTAAPEALTFSGNVGATNDVSAINIGDAANGGNAVFQGTVAALNVTVTGADSANETSSVTFQAATTIPTLTLTGGGAATADATAQFQNSATLTTVRLDDVTGQAEVTFNATNGAQSIAAAIDGAATVVGGEGKLIVIDDDTDPAQAITFTANIGATNQLLAIEVGSAAESGAAVFNGTTSAGTITLRAAESANETALATFTGDVTAGSFDLVGGGDATADATATVTGNLTTTTITLDDVTGQSTIIFNGTSTQTIAGAIDGVTAGDGTLTVSGTDVKFSNAIGDTRRLALLTVNAGAKATLAAGNLGATAVNSSGTLQLDGTVVLEGTTTVDLAAANATFIMGSTASTYTNNVLIDATTNDEAVNLTANLTVTPHSSFTSGTIKLVDANTGGNIDNNVAQITINDTALIDYTVAANGQDVEITANRKSAAATASELGVSADAAAALGSAVDATVNDAALTAIFNTILIAGGAEATKAATQTQNDPGALTAAGSASADAGAASFTTVGTRLAALRSDTAAAYASGDAKLGFAAGEGALASSVWVKPFFSSADQDKRSGVEGYQADVKGIAAGIDTEVSEGLTIGMMGSFAETDVDGDGDQNSQTDINSYQVGVYGDYSTSKFYVEGMVAYGRNSVDTNRTIDFGGLNLLAAGSFDSSQYQAKIGGGAPIQTGSWWFTPNASLSYTRVGGESFTETGAGALNLNVDQDDLVVFLGQVGAKFHTNIKNSGGVFTPEIRANLFYDFEGDEAESTSRFANGAGAAFKVTGADVAELGGSLGVGLSYQTGRTTFGISYDASAKDDYLSHNGTMSARWRF